MPELNAHDGSANRKAKEFWANDGVADRKAREVWTHDGGAWRMVFSGFTVSMPSSLTVLAATLSPNAVATIRFETDGVITMIRVNGGTTTSAWGSPTSSGEGANYWVRATLDSGTSPSGPALGSWHQLSSARAWALTQTSSGVSSCQLTIQIASDSGGSNILSTCTVTLEAEVA
jgi:hypothetical protein